MSQRFANQTSLRCLWDTAWDVSKMITSMAAVSDFIFNLSLDVNICWIEFKRTSIIREIQIKNVWSKRDTMLG